MRLSLTALRIWASASACSPHAAQVFKTLYHIISYHIISYHIISNLFHLPDLKLLSSEKSSEAIQKVPGVFLWDF
jgi:hypothetical protein